MIDKAAFDLLVKNVDTLKADTEKKLDKTEKKIDTIDEKIDRLLEFKWQIVGGAGVVSIILTVAFQIIMNLTTKQ